MVPSDLENSLCSKQASRPPPFGCLVYIGCRLSCQILSETFSDPGSGGTHRPPCRLTWREPSCGSGGGPWSCVPLPGAALRTFMAWYLSESRTLSTSSHTPCSSSSCGRRQSLTRKRRAGGPRPSRGALWKQDPGGLGNEDCAQGASKPLGQGTWANSQINNKPRDT